MNDKEDQSSLQLLLSLAVAMFITSYCAGLIPTYMNLSKSKMRMFSIFGAGLLLGTSLGVILPEGIHVIYTTDMAEKEHFFNSSSQHNASDESLINGGDASLDKRTIDHSVHEGGAELRGEEVDGSTGGIVGVEGSMMGDEDRNTSGSVVVVMGGGTAAIGDGIVGVPTNKNGRIRTPATPTTAHRHHHHHVEGDDHQHLDSAVPADREANSHIHRTIGLTLMSGFLLMLFIDEIGKTGNVHGGDVDVPNTKRTINNGEKTLITGLLIHAVADGIALGAASSSNQYSLELLVFVAMMIHKLPAIVGMVSILLKKNIDRISIHHHVILFSLATPISSMATYFFITFIMKSQGSSMKSTGISLLFSAGTFLYVSTVHVLPELKRCEEEGGHPCRNDLCPVDKEEVVLCKPSNVTTYNSSTEPALDIVGNKSCPVLHKHRLTTFTASLSPNSSRPSLEIGYPVAKVTAGDSCRLTFLVPGDTNVADVVTSKEEEVGLGVSRYLHHPSQEFTKSELATLVFGCVCPLFTSLGHTH